MKRDLHALGFVLRLFLAERRSLLFAGALLSAMAFLCGIALIGLSGWFITATALAGLSTGTALGFDVFAPAAAIRLLALARTGTRYGERLVTHNATLRVLAALRERLFRGTAEARSAFAMTMHPAKILFQLTLDLDAMDSLYLRLFVPAVSALAATALVVVALGFLDPLAGIALGGALLLAGFGIAIAAAAAGSRPARRRANAIEVLRSRVIDIVSGQVEFLMAGRLGAQRQFIVAADARLAAADDALNRIDTAAAAALGIVESLLLGATLLFVGRLSASGAISAPVTVFGLLVVLGSVEPFAALRRGAVEFGRTALAARRVGPRLRGEWIDPAAVQPGQSVAVRLDQVSVGYPGSGETALRNVSFVIRRGERVALVGSSGAGKSTLLALIAGDLAAAEGLVEREPATLLTQRTQLFQDTLRDNLRLASPSANDCALGQALKAAGLDADIAALPGGLAAPLGEGGMGLSGGQARRLALARLLLCDAPLWLLDEPTEGLDGATARDVLVRLSACAAGRTIVVATHIRREAEIADRLLMVEEGRIVASTHRGEPGFEATLARLRPD